MALAAAMCAHTVKFLFVGLVCAQDIEWWVTDNGAQKLSPQSPLSWTHEGASSTAFLSSDSSSSSGAARIVVNADKQFQTVYGFGSSLEASSAYNLYKLNETTRLSAIRQLFDPDSGIGLTLARITIGTSDFAPLPFYTYNDLADPYEADVNLTQFSVAHDEAYVLPTIKLALEAAGVPGKDTLRIFASPWSPPAWMKTSHVLGGGTLLAAQENTYARYLLRFLSAYEARGVHVDALTIQNEPLNNDSRYPCMLLQPEQEGRVIEQMYRVFQEEGLRSLPAIWSFDQNFADWWYPAKLLNNTQYARFVNGSAFHHYAGSPSDMTKLHEAFPDTPIMFTEGSGFGLWGAGHIVNIFRNWATTYTSWVTMLDKDRKPNSGPWGAGETMLELDGPVQDGQYSVKYNYEYYMYGQFSKFVRTGAIRIDSGSTTTWLNHVAFVNPSSARGTGNAGATVVIVVNNWFWTKNIQLGCGGRVVTARLPGRSVATFRWKQQCTMESGEQVIV